MSDYTLDGPTALRLLDAVVEKYGEDHEYHVPSGYSICQYAPHDGEPGCIIGTIFAEQIGIPVPQSMEGVGVTVPKFAVPGVTITKEAKHILGEAQDAQDEGHTWGWARDHAYEWAEYKT
jgi:hypothetical protein